MARKSNGNPTTIYIDPTTKDLIKKLRDNNVPLGRVYSILGLTDQSKISSSTEANNPKLLMQNVNFF